MFIFHVLSLNEYKEIMDENEYRPISLEEEGYIHFSFSHQLEGVLRRFYKQPQGLVLIKVRIEQIKDKLKLEGPLDPEEAFDEFPHVYRSLFKEDISGHHHLEIQDDLSFELPWDWINEEA